MTCKECKHFDTWDNEKGKCKRYPPVLIRHKDPPYVTELFEFPSVNSKTLLHSFLAA